MYFDTNALKGLSFDRAFLRLMNATKDGVVQVSVSEFVIWELARKDYEEDISNTRKYVPEDKDIRQRMLRAKYDFYREMFETNNIQVIDHTTNQEERLSEVFANPKANFGKNAANIDNDRRDIHIYLAAVDNFNPENVLIMCEERSLGNLFASAGFTVVKDTKTFLKDEVLGEDWNKTYSIAQPDIQAIMMNGPKGISPILLEELKKSDPDFAQVLENQDPILADSEILNNFMRSLSEQDEAIRLRIIGFLDWFGDTIKDVLTKFVSSQLGIEPLLVEKHCEVLISTGIIGSTENHYLSIKSDSYNDIYEQAGLSIRDEILTWQGIE